MVYDCVSADVGADIPTQWIGLRRWGEWWVERVRVVRPPAVGIGWCWAGMISKDTRQKGEDVPSGRCVMLGNSIEH